jgi:hypothetical protein
MLIENIRLFVSQVLNGEPLGVFKLIVLIILILWMKYHWQKGYKKWRSLFKVVAYSVTVILVLGLIFQPELILMRLSQAAGWFQMKWTQWYTANFRN